MDYKNESLNLMFGDCLQRLKELPDQSVDAVITDPPYGIIKGLNNFNKEKEDGTIQENKRTGSVEWDTKIELEPLLDEINRVLKVNGALILFGQEPFTSEITTKAHSNIPFSYRLIWKKCKTYRNPFQAKKMPILYYEDISIFFKKYDYTRKHPLRSYSESVLNFIGKKVSEVSKDLGHTGAQRFLGFKALQFGIPTEKTYNQLISIYGINKMDGFIEYNELKELYTSYNPIRVFNLPENEKSKSGILEYPREVKGRLHPTQKPVALMEDLIYTYTNEGMTVLDFTMGSGSTGVACQNLNHKFIGIEKDEGYYNIAKERLLNNCLQK